ncbi:MAG TPA: class I SAM-dependent methyltransferase [Herpetosiphonaceae bacterium]
MSAESAAYEAYARHYDEGQLHFSVLMYGYLAEVLARHRPPPERTLIDLACGTGTLALMLADDGWDVLGIDGSRAMLREAQRKARRGAGLERSIRFRRADMRDWSASAPVSLVTCCYDSLNYLLEEADLLAAFRAVRAALAPGGLWIFDINTPFFLTNVWDPVEVEERDGYAHVMQTGFEPARCLSTLTLTGFARRADGLYERFDERHAERGYGRETLARLLAEAGFAVEAVYECFVLTEPTPASHRWLWVCRNPESGAATLRRPTEE